MFNIFKHKPFRIYETYNKVNDVFVEPKLKWKLGLWKNDPNLPVWTREFRKKLRKRGLSWLPTQIHLPLWLSFYLYNEDLCWKTKYSDYRYEFPPQFTIVLFGISLSVWLVNPFENDGDDMDYWESILWYIHYKDLSKVDENMGNWHKWNNEKNEEDIWPRLDINYLNEPFKSGVERWRLTKTKK